MDLLDQYISCHSSAEPDVLKELVRQTHLRVLQPRMLSGHVQGRLLALLTQLISPRRVLELGTFTGYSAISIALAMNGGELHTVDSNDELESFARDFFVKAGLENIVVQHIGKALEILPTFTGAFDLIFIDADKREYLDYYKAIFKYKLVRSGTVIIADNTIWDEKVVRDVASNDRQTLGIMAFNDFVAADNLVDKVMLPLRDGLTIIRVK